MHAMTFAVLGLVFLLAFAALAAVDGVYLHLWRLRLHRRAASYGEHLWHTASAVLFVPIVALLFARPASGAMLWVAMGLLAALHVVEVLDVRSERESRRDLGGLSRSELAIHVAAVGTRTAAVVLWLVARPAGVWRLEGPHVAETFPPVALHVGELVTAGAIAVAIVHVWLAALHCPVCRPARLRARMSTRPPEPA